MGTVLFLLAAGVDNARLCHVHHAPLGGYCYSVIIRGNAAELKCMRENIKRGRPFGEFPWTRQSAEQARTRSELTPARTNGKGSG